MLKSIGASEIRFRAGTVKTGLWLSFLPCAGGAVYYALTWDRPHRALLAGAAVIAFIGTVALALAPIERLLSTRWREPFFLVWSGVLIAFVALGAILDGGAMSPVAIAFFLP